METKFKFEALKERIRKMKEVLPVQLAAQAQSFFVGSWANQGWDGAGWQTPKRRIDGTPEWKYPKKKDLGRRTRATLVKTGTLRRAVNNSIRSQVFGEKGVRLMVDLPYAAAHNEGGNFTIGAHSRANYINVKSSHYNGLKQSKKTGKFYMSKKTTNISIRGEGSTVKEHSRELPKRQFMGDSPILRVKQIEKIKKFTDNVWIA